MDTVTYPDSRVAEHVTRHFIPLRVPVKEDHDLTDEYVVNWTPSVVIADEQGRVHSRIEGYHGPEDFVARLSLGLGKFLLNHSEFGRAAERFEGVVERHTGTESAAEALYWLGVALYRESREASMLRPSWERLAREYADSEWAKRTRIPGL